MPSPQLLTVVFYACVLTLLLITDQADAFGMFKKCSPTHHRSVKLRDTSSNRKHDIPTLQTNSFDPEASKDPQLAASRMEVVIETDKVTKLLDSPAVWRAILLLLCILWATNFPVIKLIYQLVPNMDSPLLLATRFSIASIFFIPSIGAASKDLSFLKAGSLMCLPILFGHIGQAQGLVTSTADKGAFIGSLSVVWVALLDTLITRKVKLQTWVSSILAVVGECLHYWRVPIFPPILSLRQLCSLNALMQLHICTPHTTTTTLTHAGTAFLELEGNTPPSLGDLWFTLQPIGYGLGYILLEQLLKKFPSNADAATGLKMGSVSVAAVAWSAANGHTLADLQPLVESPVALACMLYISCITAALATAVQSYVFKRVPATEVTIVLSLEPVFASIGAAYILGEQLDSSEVTGGALIIAACIAQELNIVNRLFPGIGGGSVEPVDEFTNK